LHLSSSGGALQVPAGTAAAVNELGPLAISGCSGSPGFCHPQTCQQQQACSNHVQLSVQADGRMLTWPKQEQQSEELLAGGSMLPPIVMSTAAGFVPASAAGGLPPVANAIAAGSAAVVGGAGGAHWGLGSDQLPHPMPNPVPSPSGTSESSLPTGSDLHALVFADFEGLPLAFMEDDVTGGRPNEGRGG
jgi:hypothetical protein